MDNLKAYYFTALKAYSRLSLREKVIIVVPTLALLLYMFSSLIVSPVNAAFMSQKAALEQAEGNVKIFSAMLEKNTKLRLRRKVIEDQYKEIETKEGGFTLLERLLKEILNLPPAAFNIKDGSTQEFGGNYEKTPYTVKLTTSDIPALVKFLKEITQGKNPFIMKRLDMRRRGDRIIEVEFEASSIKRKG